MKIAFFSNFLNHHQVPVADELYKLLGSDYFFVETQPMPETYKKTGYPDFSEKPYLVQEWKGNEEMKHAMNICMNSDACIFGGAGRVLYYKKKRLAESKLSFDYSERVLKRGWINIFSPINLVSQLYYHFDFYKKPYYKLCAGAFCANDMYLMRSFQGKCYKYGYFPLVEDFNIDDFCKEKRRRRHAKILWCARFIEWKHPELAVKLGSVLKKKGYDFEINMIGKGELWENINKRINKEGLYDCVHLLGAVVNSEVLKIMRDHDIFLFSSDQNEGWGAVLNESMGQGCCPVASDKIGATPFLLKHKKNGMIFKSGDYHSMVESVTYLLDNPQERIKMSKEAYHQVKELWSPEVAAMRLYELIVSLMSAKSIIYDDGPLSPAVPI